MISSMARSSPFRAAAIRDSSVGSRRTRRWSCTAALDLGTAYLRGKGKAGSLDQSQSDLQPQLEGRRELLHQDAPVSNWPRRGRSAAAAHALERLAHRGLERVAQEPARWPLLRLETFPRGGREPIR